MAPYEFDKPSTAPIHEYNEGSQDDGLQIQHVDESGRAILQDAMGNIAYPSYLPPDVDLIHSPTSPASTGLSGSAKTVDPAELPTKSKSLPLPNKDGAVANNGRSAPRPQIDKRFATELPPRRDARASGVPGMVRAGTNVSGLNEMLWKTYGAADEDDSSSSSDDDADDNAAVHTPGSVGASPRIQQASERDRFRRLKVGNENYNTEGKVSRRDGRLNITVNDTSTTGYLAKALGTAVRTMVTGPKNEEHATESDLTVTNAAVPDYATRPKLNIVIMVIGSRGDAQPFLKIGKVLKENYGHRVRIATHPAFKDFVEKDSGLEFFSVGGDPSELMAFMVKNPGMIPKLETVKAGDIGKRRAQMAQMFKGFWRACINATDDETDINNLKLMGEKDAFVADAIIANPPSFAHIHCAEALGIPLHLMFTFPYTPTQAFPHPLASIKKSNVDPGYTNFISYPLVDLMVWQGLGDLVNDFRVRTLGLDPVSTLWAPGTTYRLHVPFTYLWSPGLVPKPEDWGDEVDVSGFVFLDLASSFDPPKELTEFLAAGEPPIYIGFGSIVVDDADKFTEMIFEAVKLAGVRALVSKGWGGLGQDNVPDYIYMLENTPHDWLFPQISACVIHGGAGTTAIALKCAKPTMVVPFFGDQHFWGAMISSSGAGPEPVPFKKLSAEKLADGIRYCLTDEARSAVQRIADDIALEGDGAENAVNSFHAHLPLSGEDSMRCSILEDRVANWRVRHTSIRLSSLAADIIVERGGLSWRKLRLLRHKEWNDFEGPGEPFTGVAGSLMTSVGEMFAGVGSVPVRMAKASRRIRDKRLAKKLRRKGRVHSRNTKASELNRHSTRSSGGIDLAETASILTTTTADGTGTGDAAAEYMNEVSKGVGKSGWALANAPVDLSMALAQGFHNAPRLYGDPTVRPPPRVTGIKSGLRAARSEFAYGVYDGVTGLVRLPYHGARNDGVKGALAGVGMGIGGFVLKDIAALIAPFGYTLKGISKQVERGRGPAGRNGKMIRRARIIQAQREMRDLSPEERKHVEKVTRDGWAVIRKLGEVVAREDGRRGIIGHIRGDPPASTDHLNRSSAIPEQSARQGTPKKSEEKDEPVIKDLERTARGPAFENVDNAKNAIKALEKGGGLNAVLGRDSMLGRNSEERARKSLEKGSRAETRPTTDTEKEKKLRPLDEVPSHDTTISSTEKGADGPK